MKLRFLRAGAVIGATALGALTVTVLDGGDRDSAHADRTHASVRHQHSTLPNGRTKAMHAVWAFRPRSLGELSAKSKFAVLATVTSVTDGPPISDDSKADPASALPTMRIGLRTDDTLLGDAPAHFTIFKTGSQQLTVDDDPDYVVGAQYILFLTPRINGDGTEEPATYLPVAPDGRLRLTNDAAQASIDGPVANELSGRSIAEVEDAVAAANGTN